MIEFRVSLPNEPGKLGDLGEAMAENLVNVRALAGIASASPTIAFVVDQEDMMRATLQKLQLPFEEIDLLTIKLDDKAGELGAFTSQLRDVEVNIDSIYVLNKHGGQVEIAFSADKMTDAKLVLDL